MDSENWINKEWNDKVSRLNQIKSMISKIYQINPNLEEFISLASENVIKARGLGYKDISFSKTDNDGTVSMTISNYTSKSYEHTNKRFARIAFIETGAIVATFVIEMWWRDYFDGSSFTGEETIEKSKIQKTYNNSQMTISALVDIIGWVCNRNENYGK